MSREPDTLGAGRHRAAAEIYQNIHGRQSPCRRRRTQRPGASLDRSNALTLRASRVPGLRRSVGRKRYAIDAAMRAAERDPIAVNATGCLEVSPPGNPETRGCRRIRYSAATRLGGR